MRDVTYRTFRPDDTDRLVELIARGMPGDAVSREWFAEYVLLDPNFDAHGLIVAADADTGEPLGFVYAVRSRSTAGIPVDPDGGWITVGAVHATARRHGIGTELARRAMAYLRAEGSRWVVYSGYPPAYFLPGLDVDAYPDGLRLLERAGFQTVSRPVAMDRSLPTYRPPPATMKKQATREDEGYRFGPASVGEIPEVMTFASSSLAPDWGEVIRQAVVRSGRPDRVVLARDPVGAVVGFATFGAYRGAVERFGPFGVDEASRGLGLGAILLHATLGRMRAESAHSAWFLWTGEETPAGQLYLNAGFAVTRRFHVLRADLQHPASLDFNPCR